MALSCFSSHKVVTLANKVLGRDKMTSIFSFIKKVESSRRARNLVDLKYLKGTLAFLETITSCTSTCVRVKQVCASHKLVYNISGGCLFGSRGSSAVGVDGESE